MTLSKKIGSILGPTMIMINISEVINFHIWKVNNPAVTYLNGMIIFAIGLAIIRFHNIWTKDWTTLVTLYGWILLIGGFLRLFFPEMKQLEPGPFSYSFILILLIGALTITIQSYRRGNNKE